MYISLGKSVEAVVLVELLPIFLWFISAAGGKRLLGSVLRAVHVCSSVHAGVEADERVFCEKAGESFRLQVNEHSKEPHYATISQRSHVPAV